MTCPCMRKARKQRRPRRGVRRYTAAELERKKTLSTGQCDDLKVDTGRERVWLSRCTRADGEPFNNKVTVEWLIAGRWKSVDEYQG